MNSWRLLDKLRRFLVADLGMPMRLMFGALSGIDIAPETSFRFVESLRQTQSKAETVWGMRILVWRPNSGNESILNELNKTTVHKTEKDSARNR